MSLEVWGDEPDDFGPTDSDVEEAFVNGAQACREMLARFIEQGGDAVTAASVRANWNPAWGKDPGPITGIIPDGAWS